MEFPPPPLHCGNVLLLLWKRLKWLTWCFRPPSCRLLLPPSRSTDLWRLYRTWMVPTQTISPSWCKQESLPPTRPFPNLLLAFSVSFATRQRHLDHTGSESDPQGVTLAVYVHADDALVINAVDAAPEGRRGAGGIHPGERRDVKLFISRLGKKEGLECGGSAGER